MIEELEAPGYMYHDLPQMTPEYFDKFIEIIGEDNITWLTLATRPWPDGTITKRGQMMVSPAGQARGKAYAERIDK